MTILFNPKFFNILLLILFAAATVRWAIAGNWSQTLYNGCAFGLNWAVLFMEMK